MVKNIAIIPARSGSKRVPDKNILDFMGKPIIAYTIEAAIASGIFDTVFVSTDSEKYAEIAQSYGASVPFLRDSHNDDFSSLAQVMVYVLETIQEKTGTVYDNFCSLQASCPLRDESVIKSVYDFFTKSNAPTVLTCSSFNFMNPWWSFKMNNHEADFILSDPTKNRSQDNQELFCPTGAVGFAKVEEFKKNATFYGNEHKFFPINWKSAVDIDNYEDIEFAKAVYAMVNSCHSA